MMRTRNALLLALFISVAAAADAQEGQPSSGSSDNLVYGEIHGDWRVLPHGARAASASQREAVHGATLRYLCTKRRDGIAERLELHNPSIAQLEAGARHTVYLHFDGQAKPAEVTMQAWPSGSLLRATDAVGSILERMGRSQRMAITQEAGAVGNNYPVSTDGFAAARTAARQICRNAPEITPDGRGKGPE